MSLNKFHKAFKLQGKTFNSVEELLGFSLSISVEVHSFLKEWFSESEFIEVKTSGSTGTPKVIRLQKKHMINSAIATGSFFNLNESTTALLCMSPVYIAGKMMLVRALKLGWELDVVAPVSNPLEGLKKNFDFSAMVPIQLYNSLDQIHQLKKVIVGGGVISNEIINKIQNISTEIYATYGMTETITHIAVKKLNCHSKSSEESQRKKNSCSNADSASIAHYKILPNIKISKDKRDCLVINAPKISSEEIVTNDLVELISSNEFVWKGRFDTVINSGGIKLIPEEIEQKLAEIIKQRFFVYGMPDSVLGEKLVLIIESESGTNCHFEHVEEFKARIKNLKTLFKYEAPKELYFVAKFIETENKKINRPKSVDLILR